MEKRRLRAITLLESGTSYRTVASAVGASLSNIVGWAEIYDREGSEGLKSKPIPGRPSHLTEAQQRELEKILLKGALKAGYSTDLWTLKPIAEVIKKQFAVRYHPGHVWKIMKSLGWSCQKPERRALQRDEEAIRKWKRYQWPRIKKKPKNLVPIWFSSMKAAFYSFPTCAELGHQKERRRCITTLISAVKFPPSVRFLFLPSGSIWPSTCNSMKEMSRVWTLKLSSAICSSIYKVTLFSYGTIPPYIGVSWL
ncbi:MAG TPA: IS630 family transposase, partial [Nitrososphaera sp.]|nr:IS630 family transposase [Nitrososphaera sp.]